MTARPPGPDGLVVVDKPSGWTSHDVVAKARGILGTRKIGHAGTLDPDATGVLVLGVGRGTRLLQFLSVLPKAYSATIGLGVETTTLDAAGEVTAVFDMSSVDPAAVHAAAAGLTGHLQQVPPMVSAVKVGGRRLHELARQGVEVERAPRPVTVHRFDVTPTDDPLVWQAEVVCSSGTYVRVLAADLGRALGGGAHLLSLRRRAVGGFTEADAVSLDALELSALLPLSVMRTVLASRIVDDELAARVRVGAVLTREQVGAEGPGPWLLLDRSDEVLAVYQAHRGDTVKPAVVLAST